MGDYDMGTFVSNVARLLENSARSEYYQGVQDSMTKMTIDLIQEIIQQSLKQGMKFAEDRTRIDIAKNMILAGADDDFVFTVTGLDDEKIKELREGLKK